jgi:hypothetical protein
MIIPRYRGSRWLIISVLPIERRPQARKARTAERPKMTRVLAFHSVNESRSGRPRYHTDDACPQAQQIPRQDLRQESGGYFQCERCIAMHEQPVASSHLIPPPVIAAA